MFQNKSVNERLWKNVEEKLVKDFEKIWLQFQELSKLQYFSQFGFFFVNLKLLLKTYFKI